MSLLLACIALIAVISLCSWWYCWQDVRGGRPNILSLRQVTLIMDRNVLDMLYGKHGPGYVYALNKSALEQILRTRRWFVYKEMFVDMLCFAGVYRYITGIADPDFLVLFLFMATSYQALSIWYSIQLVRKWWHQIEEEMDQLH